MQELDFLPFVKGTIHFEYDDTRIKMIVDFSDYGVDDEVTFVRCDGRWRHLSGPFVSVHTIAARIFEYQQIPTKQEMEFMGQYVTDIGILLDATWQVIQDASAARIKARQERIKSFVQDDEIVFVTQSDGECNYEEEKTFVYLMKHSNGLTKIGRSKNPQTREKTLQAEDPRLEMIFYCEACKYIERRLHQIFNSVRVRGEWFRLMAHHVDWIMFFLKDQNNCFQDTAATKTELAN